MKASVCLGLFLSFIAQISFAAATINLNTATAKILTKSVKGIGLKRAESIVKYREAHGPFKSVTDLNSVPLIGKNFVSSHLEEMQRVFVVK